MRKRGRDRGVYTHTHEIHWEQLVDGWDGKVGERKETKEAAAAPLGSVVALRLYNVTLTEEEADATNGLLRKSFGSERLCKLPPPKLQKFHSIADRHRDVSGLNGRLFTASV